MGHEMFDMWSAMKHASYTRVINELKQTMYTFDGDVDEIIKLALDKISLALHSEASSFWLYHLNGDGMIKPHAFSGGADISAVRLFPGEGIVGKVIAKGEPLIIEDCSKDEQFAHRVDDHSGFSTKTMICVPAVYNSMTFGCIQLINKKDDTYFDKKDLELAIKFSEIVTEVLEKRNILEQYGYGDANNGNSIAKKGIITNVATMFVDMEGFTELAFSVKPEVLGGVLNSYMIYVSNIITKYNGQFDKIMCDRILSFWGVPDKVENPVLLACKAALEIVENIDELKEVIRKKYNVSISLKIGISYGEAYVGNIGVKQCLDYTAVGKEISIAKFMATSAMPNTVCISENVADMLIGKKEFSLKKYKTLKASNEKIDVYQISHDLF